MDKLFRSLSSLRIDSFDIPSESSQYYTELLKHQESIKTQLYALNKNVELLEAHFAQESLGPTCQPSPEKISTGFEGPFRYVADMSCFIESPGPIGNINPLPTVTEDFSKANRPTHQVTVATFWSFFEPYFRHLTEEDIAFLEQEESEVQNSYFVVPPLGQPYTEKWKNQDTGVVDMISGFRGLGPLTERIVCAFIESDVMDTSEIQIVDYTSLEDVIGEIRTQTDLIGLEDRIKHELFHAGILRKDDVAEEMKTEDEVLKKLRKMQSQLKEQMDVNHKRKRKLLEVVKDKMGDQQYGQVLEELDKVVEQAFLKHYPSPKKKKKFGPSVLETQVVHPKDLSEAALYALERRKKWIEEVGIHFKDWLKYESAQNIFEKEELEEKSTIEAAREERERREGSVSIKSETDF